MVNVSFHEKCKRASIASGTATASHVIDRFCKNNRLNSGIGNERGDTAQYDNASTLMVVNESYLIESKVILDSAPAISTGVAAAVLARHQDRNIAAHY
eukprot:scaffold3559_cov284-Chaetoceros_neogracile.AAC.33